MEIPSGLGLAAVTQFEKDHSAFTAEEMADADARRPRGPLAGVRKRP
jgi:hypothetical protein